MRGLFMSEILIHKEDLQQTASQFKNASSNILASMNELDNAISLLERKWSGSTQQIFYRKYKDLHQAMEGMNALMNNIAKEMNTMADRMNKIDTQDEYKG
jgi:WXG100 family type VII secretion target